MGPLFQQTMKARLGLGKPIDGYSMATNPMWGNAQTPTNGGITPPHMLGGGPGPMNAIGLPTSPVIGSQPIPFEPRPQGGTLPIEQPWNPHQTGYQPRPQNPYETPYNPHSRGFENRPQDGGMETGWGGQYSPWRKF